MKLIDLRREGQAFFFPKSAARFIGYDLTEELINTLTDTTTTLRICLHDGPNDPIHDMIIAAKKDYDFPAHRHGNNKDETICVLRGTVEVFLYENEEHFSSYMLRPNCIFRIPSGVFHSVNAYSPIVVYHESKVGPFLGEADREFAPWVAR